MLPISSLHKKSFLLTEMAMAKGKGKLDGDGASQQRTISWDDEQVKFMLDCYIKYRKRAACRLRVQKATPDEVS